MELRYYTYAGLEIASEIPLPEWAPFERSGVAGDPDVVIFLDRTLDADPGPGSRRIVTASEYRFAVPGIGAFRVTDGRRIAAAPAAGVAPARLRPWLIGSAWGSLCYQRGLFLIHASAVEIDGQAILFCARTKGGKSTMAAQLNARGHALITDDLCHLDIPAHGAPVVYPSVPRLKLWDDSLSELGWSTGQREPDPFRAGKFHLVPAVKSGIQPTPVCGIYLLQWGEFGIRPLSGMAALRRFLPAATYRPRLLGSMGQVATHSRRSMLVLQRVPVWELQRPRELSAVGSTADLLRSQWSEHRMMNQ